MLTSFRVVMLGVWMYAMCASSFHDYRLLIFSKKNHISFLLPFLFFITVEYMNVCNWWKWRPHDKFHLLGFHFLHSVVVLRQSDGDKRRWKKWKSHAKIRNSDATWTFQNTDNTDSKCADTINFGFNWLMIAAIKWWRRTIFFEEQSSTKNLTDINKSNELYCIS